MNKYLTEAFQKLDLLEGETFGVDKKGIEELDIFLKDAVEPDFVPVIDPMKVEGEEISKDIHTGQSILCCPVCKAKIYKDVDDVIIDKDMHLANVGELCPECFSSGGFKIVGRVAPYEDITVESDKDVLVKVDGKDITVGNKETEENVSLGSVKEAYLEPAHDSRKSFYNKARVSEDGNTLYSYEVKVMEIKDGQPRLLIKDRQLSQTTLRHIKEFLKQHGFKAESKLQIMQDYGNVDEELEASQKYPIESPFKKGDTKDCIRASQKYPIESPLESIHKKANREMKEDIYDPKTGQWKPDPKPTGNKSDLDKAFERSERGNRREYGYNADLPYSMMSESDAPAATSIEDAQKWVDYDMKKYGEISDRTNRLIKKAGFQIVKDEYGDYEVIAGKYDESLRKRKQKIQRIKESLRKKRISESTKRDDIDADADNKKEFARKNLKKAIDDADADKDYHLNKRGLKTIRQEQRIGESVIKSKKKTIKEDWDWNGDKVKIANDILDFIGDKKQLSRDDFIEQFEKGIKKYCKVDDINKVYESGEIEIDGKKEDIQDVETDVRIILGLNGYETIFEGSNSGDIELTESCKKKPFESVIRPKKKTIKESKDEYEIRYKAKRDSLADIIQDELTVGEDKYILHPDGRVRATRHGINFNPEHVGVDDLGNGKYQIVAYTSLDSFIEKAKKLADRFGKKYEVGVAKDLMPSDKRNKYIKIFIDEEDWQDGFSKPDELPIEMKGREMKEGMEDISITTDKEVIKIKSTPKSGKEEIVAPTENEVETQELDTTDIAVTDDTTSETTTDTTAETTDIVADETTESAEIDEIEESMFDKLSESYLKRVYENVQSFKTIRGITRGNKIILEGVIGFKSGTKAKTRFIFEAKDMTKRGKVRFCGLNENISKKKDSYTLVGMIKNKKFMVESFNYNYLGKDNKTNKTSRIYGTVKIK